MDRSPQPELSLTQQRIDEAMDSLLSEVGESLDSLSETKPEVLPERRREFEVVILDVLRYLGVMPEAGDDEISKLLGFK